MGFIKAFAGSLSSALADQWQDYYMPKSGISSTTAFCQAVRVDGAQNIKGNSCVISNGSIIIVPEGMGLMTFQDGAITGFVAEPGGFIFKSDDPASQSLFAGNGIFKNLWQSTWDKVKFGGQVATQQLAFYVNLQDIQGVRFGSQSTIYWQDAFLATQAGAGARGTYTLKISNPLLFVKNFVDAKYKEDGALPFDFNDVENDKCNNLNEQFGSELTQNISQFSTAALQSGMNDTMVYIQSNTVQVAKALSDGVERDYQWQSINGLTISNVAIQINYDEATLALRETMRQDDAEIRKAAKMGAAFSNNMPGMMAAGSMTAMNTAAGNENGAMMGFMGMNMAQQNSANMIGAVNNLQQAAAPVETPAPVQSAPVETPTVNPETPAENPYDKLAEMKKLADAGVISQEEFEAAKKNLLGI